MMGLFFVVAHMDAELMKLLGGGGVFGSAVFFGIKYGLTALERLYNDMKEQHKEQLAESTKREEKLLAYLEQKNITDAKIASTLDNMCVRLASVEQTIGRDV